jgi:hypothetical protein
MDPAVKIAIYHAVEKEPFARALSMELPENQFLLHRCGFETTSQDFVKKADIPFIAYCAIDRTTGGVYENQAAHCPGRPFLHCRQPNRGNGVALLFDLQLRSGGVRFFLSTGK